jgi:hypothetical protein
MGTKNTTTTTNQYSPVGMATYNALQGPAAATLNSNINNPYGNAFFNQQKQAGAAATTNFGTSAARSTAQAGNALGTTGGPGLNTAFNAYNTRGNAAVGAGINNALIMGAANTRNQSLSAAMNYRPLQTGGTSVQQTSGLGTWLPQVIGLGIGAATSAFGLPDPVKGGTPFSSGAGQANFNQWAQGGYGGAPIMNPSGGPFQSAPTPPTDNYGYGDFGSPLS